ncbi:hypothetical protein C8R46DRAFT_192020 [Mycena filopes]|nr:hypothetical protein C8R46DRAFT_192020 [Mycena filopes]
MLLTRLLSFLSTSCDARCLVCVSLASHCMYPRGCHLKPADVKDVGYVINYDFPNNCEDYIHRIGRTGRAGSKGTSYTYFTTDNAKSARDLLAILKEADDGAAAIRIAVTVEGVAVVVGSASRSWLFAPRKY